MKLSIRTKMIHNYVFGAVAGSQLMMFALGYADRAAYRPWWAWMGHAVVAISMTAVALSRTMSIPPNNRTEEKKA